MDKLWNRCDVCGRFISFDDFAKGRASLEYTLPDSEFSSETYETLCQKHKEEKQQ